MNTHNICLYVEIWKIIPKLSPNTSSVLLSDMRLCCTGHLEGFVVPQLKQNFFSENADTTGMKAQKAFKIMI